MCHLVTKGIRARRGRVKPAPLLRVNKGVTVNKGVPALCLCLKRTKAAQDEGGLPMSCHRGEEGRLGSSEFSRKGREQN